MIEVTARWLDVDAASDYVCMRADKFLRAVTAGKFPQPSRALGPRMPRWDRLEIDARLENAKNVASVEDAVNAVVEEIKAKGAARRAAREARRNGSRISV